MFILALVALFGLSVLIAIYEIYEEWQASRILGDGKNGRGEVTWPTTGRYVLIFGTILLMALGFFDFH